MKRYTFGLAGCCAVLLIWNAPGVADEIPVDKPLNQFGDGLLGGIETIVRYETPAPDRHDFAFLFLAASGRPGALPMEIRVLNAKGDQLARPLTDSEGADCSLEHVALFRANKDIAAVVATRTFDGPFFSQATPGPMEIRVYQLETDGNAGGSAVFFKAQNQAVLSQPICSIDDVKHAIEAVAVDWRPSALKD